MVIFMVTVNAEMISENVALIALLESGKVCVQGSHFLHAFSHRCAT
jgi:hypothetical protein